MLQWIAIAFGCTAILFYIWQVLVVRPGLLLILLYVLRSSFVWHRQSRRETAAADFGVLSALAFYQRQLERQRNARNMDLKLWLSGISGGRIRGATDRRRAQAMVTAPIRHHVVRDGIALSIYWFFESRQRRRLEKEIEALDTIQRSLKRALLRAC
jgi:hypothetical protein